MKANYRVSVNGWSRNFADRDDAIRAAVDYSESDPEASVRVYNMYNNVIWEN